MTPRCARNDCLKLLGGKYSKGVTIRRRKESRPVYFCTDCYFNNLLEINERFIAHSTGRAGSPDKRARPPD